MKDLLYVNIISWIRKYCYDSPLVFYIFIDDHSDEKPH